MEEIWVPEPAYIEEYRPLMRNTHLECYLSKILTYIMLGPFSMLWSSHRNRMDLHPNVGFDVETNDIIHTPLASERIIYIMRLSGKSRAASSKRSKNGLREQGGATDLEFNGDQWMGMGRGFPHMDKDLYS